MPEGCTAAALAVLGSVAEALAAEGLAEPAEGLAGDRGLVLAGSAEDSAARDQVLAALAAAVSAGRDRVLAALAAAVSADLAAARGQGASGQGASAGPVNEARVPQAWGAMASPPPVAAN